MNTIPGTEIPKPVVQTDRLNGNTVAIMMAAKRALQHAKCPPAIIEQYMTAAKSGDYNNMRATTTDYVDLE